MQAGYFSTRNCPLPIFFPSDSIGLLQHRTTGCLHTFIILHHSMNKSIWSFGAAFILLRHLIKKLNEISASYMVTTVTRLFSVFCFFTHDQHKNYSLHTNTDKWFKKRNTHLCSEFAAFYPKVDGNITPPFLLWVTNPVESGSRCAAQQHQQVSCRPPARQEPAGFIFHRVATQNSLPATLVFC